MKEREMKDSGIPWIGEIPKDWETLQLKRCVSFNNGQDYKHIETSKKEGFPVYGSGGVFAFAKNYIYNGEAVLFGRKGTIDKPLYVNEKFWTVDTMYYAISKNNCLNKFIYYLANIIPYDRYSTSTALPSMTQTILGNILVGIPKIKEQKAIAEFLDRKCREIDELVIIQDKMIEELKAYKQSIITETVTKGLNPNVPLKDSGIEWIGNIPQHWEVLKMNQLCNVITDYVASGSFADLKSNVQYLDSPDFAMLVRTADLSQKNSNIKRVYVSKESYAFLNNSNLFGGEIVLPNIGASIGDVYMVPKDLYKNMTLAPNSIMIKSKYSNLYLYYYFSSSTGRESILHLGDFTAQGKFNKTDLRALRVSLPPLSEQQEIADFLDNKCSEIYKLIELKQHKIEELKDYKKSIIYEYVTGKKQVESNEI